MRCLHCHSPFSPSFSHPKFIQPPNTSLLQLTRTHPTKCLYKKNTSLKAIHSSALVLATAKPGDVSVLLQTSTVLLFVYWIANFVVPDILMKDLQSDQTSKDRKPNDDNPSEIENRSTPSSSKSSLGEKRGFNSRKK
ncbi:uncharacterized protein LOC130772544 [Actinidia eriantha]|uniref:uncharacterized protein LOC130772544 n=1 Tax=Actinidia eriantha TaxID=165200 RepID=UPI002584C332|nr:uncharacterized protein LOC130772544 [Actinidia eriantha]